MSRSMYFSFALRAGGLLAAAAFVAGPAVGATVAATHPATHTAPVTRADGFGWEAVPPAASPAV